MSPTLSLTTVTDTPAQPLTPALDAGAVDTEAADAAEVDLAESHDPHLLIPGDPATLLAAARALLHNADLHDTLAIRQRRLHDGDWSGAAADAFHDHLTRQATRHAGAADATRTAARALTELADGIDHARTHARRAALLHADSDPDQRTGRDDSGLRDQAHDLLVDTRAALEDLRTRVRAQLALAQDALPDRDRLLTDPAAGAATVVGTADTGAYATTSTPVQPVGAGPSETADAATTRNTEGVALHPGSPGGDATVGFLAIEQRPRRQIVVRTGDTLSGIATRELGDPTRWPDILDANPTLANPWQIQPGQHLTLPEDPTPDDPHHQAVPDQPGSGHPPSTPPPTALPYPTASPSPIIDTTDHGAGSDAGGIGLDEGLFIGGGLAAALSVAFLLRQRRRDRRFRPDTPDRHDRADLIKHLDDLDDLHSVDDVRGRSGRDSAARRGGTGLPDHRRGEQHPDTNTIAAGPTGATVEPRTRAPRPPELDPRGPGPRVRTATEPPMPPVVERLHYAYHRAPPTGRPQRHTPGAVTGWAGPALAPQPRRPAAPRHTADHVQAPLVVPLGLTTTTGVGVYADLTLTPVLALANHLGPETRDHQADRADRAEDVARALLLTIAAGLRTPLGDPLGHVVITRANLHRLLDLTPPLPRAVTLPSTIRVVDDLGAALDDLEVTLTHRPPRPALHSPPPAVVLIATAPRPGTPTARLQLLLARLHAVGHPHRVCAVLLGNWPTPARINIAPNATAAATTGPLPPQLAGARLFTVPRHDALDLLAALARPTDPDHTPTTTPTDNPALRDPAAHTTDAHSDDTDADTAHRLPDHDDPHAAPGHRPSETLTAMAPTPAEPGLRLQVFGRVSLRSQPDRIDALDAVAGTDDSTPTPRGQLGDRDLELLVYLALHPGGVSRERLGADLWPDTTPPTAADLDAAITALDAALIPFTGELTRPAIHAVRADQHGHHQLNLDLVATDYGDFTAALADRRDATTADQRATADRALLHHYRGALAPDLHTDWINPLRRHATRAAVTAALDLAHYLHDEDDPDQAVAVLHHAIAVIEPCNEALYAALIRLHRDHDRPEAALRAFAALVTQLATIEATPSPDITALIGLS